MKELRAYLREQQEKHGISESRLAKLAGVNQSTVNRVAQQSRPRRRMSKGLIKLCSYAGISRSISIEINPSQSDELMRAMRLAWDGTEAHAKALARVIRELGRLSNRSAEDDAELGKLR